jgi:hypothetical protein
MRSKGWLMIGAVLTMGMMVGCDKTYTISIRNTSPVARELEVKDPNGFHPLGVLEPGKARVYRLKLAKDELPAACELTAGDLKKPFTLNSKDKDQQYIYLEEGAIVGPIDENTQVNRSSKFTGKSSETVQPVIKGNNAAPPANGGNEKVIDQHEVVD